MRIVLALFGAAMTSVGSILLAIGLHRIKRGHEWHHGYLGMIVLWASIPVTLFLSRILGAIMMFVAGLLLLDDGIAHFRQSIDPKYLALAKNFRPGTMGGLDAPYSPLHKLWAKTL